MFVAFLGYESRAVCSGLAALEEVGRFDPDVVILDIGLPDLSGYEVARELRRRAGQRTLYLAAVTGWGQLADRIRALEAGFDQHVLKPSDAEKIQHILELAEQRFSASAPDRA
jgi:two-component system, OmpR family, response regulator